MVDRAKSDPFLGLVLGVSTACGLTLIAVGLYFVRGPEQFGDVPLLMAIGTYFAGGVLGGPIVGFALPLTVRRGGATVVGSAVALAIYFPLAAILPVVRTGWIGAALVGGIVGFAIWTPVGEEPGSEEARSSSPDR